MASASRDEGIGGDLDGVEQHRVEHQAIGPTRPRIAQGMRARHSSPRAASHSQGSKALGPATMSSRWLVAHSTIEVDAGVATVPHGRTASRPSPEAVGWPRVDNTYDAATHDLLTVATPRATAAATVDNFRATVGYQAGLAKRGTPAGQRAFVVRTPMGIPPRPPAAPPR